ncbi:RNA polymerase sigma factor [Enterovirga rhinocerotis]|nr:RNA polymerase sigma factor [Enterovirga rhinocerotis]
MTAEEDAPRVSTHAGKPYPPPAEVATGGRPRSTRDRDASFEPPGASPGTPQDEEGEISRLRVVASDPDLPLAREAAAGSRVAFEALLRQHYDRIHRIAWRMTGSSADAEDVAQDVCCALVETIATFRGEARFTTWLSGIVINACRDHLRRRQAQERQREGLSVLADLAAPADGRDLYRQSWLASEIGRLPADLRETILLVAGEGLTHAEAGTALGIAETTVSWRLHEARRLVADRP